MSRAEELWERLVRAALRRERTGDDAFGQPAGGIAGNVPSALAKNRDIDEILRVADEIQDDAPTVSRILCEHAYSLSQIWTPTVKAEEFYKSYRKKNNVDKLLEEEMQLRESGAFSRNFGELERKTVKRKRVFATLKVLGTVLEQLSEEIPDELKRVMESDSASTEDLIAYNIIPIDAASSTNAIAFFPEVQAAISALKYFNGLPELPRAYFIPPTRNANIRNRFQNPNTIKLHTKTAFGIYQKTSWSSTKLYSPENAPEVASTATSSDRVQMSRAEELWERLVRAALRRERTGDDAFGQPAGGIAGNVPSALAKNRDIDEILRVADEIQDDAPTVSRILCEHAYSLSQIWTPTVKAEEFYKSYRKKNNVDKLLEEEMQLRESGAFSRNLGELERKTVKRKRVFATLKVLGTVLEQLSEEIPDELKRVMESDSASTEDLIAYNIIPIDAASSTNAIAFFPEVQAAISALKYFNGLPELPRAYFIPPTRNANMLDFLQQNRTQIG
ncbi:hypothetical protein RYX36_019907 [Vicia faba]